MGLILSECFRRTSGTHKQGEAPIHLEIFWIFTNNALSVLYSRLSRRATCITYKDDQSYQSALMIVTCIGLSVRAPHSSKIERFILLGVVYICEEVTERV